MLDGHDGIAARTLATPSAGAERTPSPSSTAHASQGVAGVEAANRTWGRASSRAPYHRLTGVAHGSQVVACGDIVLVADTYHCDPAAGPDARPSIGTVCPTCADTTIAIVACESRSPLGAWVEVTWADAAGEEYTCEADVVLGGEMWWTREGAWPAGEADRDLIDRVMVAEYEHVLSEARSLFRDEVEMEEVGQ